MRGTLARYRFAAVEGILAILLIFGMPVFLYWLRRHYNAMEKGLLKPAGEPRRIEELEKEKKLLAERVANLESIVCSVEFDLNQRLDRLTIDAGPPSALRPPPPPAPALPAARQPAVPAASPASVAVLSPAHAGVAATMDAALIAAGPAPGGTLAEVAATAERILFGRYRVERELGRGGMGAVFLAHDLQLGEQVALKIMSARSGGDPESMAERFRREASAARRVTHPNVIRIFEFGEADGDLFLSMEYFAGHTLQELIRRRGALPLDEARAVLGQVCEGLAAAHRAGVVHRDLKPANVLVGSAGSVKLIDFGLAKAAFRSTMTATGVFMGTPDYMPPEQVRGRPVDARADIYSLGALAYHLVEGRPPFSGDTPIAVGFAHCTQPVPPPARPDLSPRAGAAIVRALAKDPRDRFETVEAMREELVA